jgi:hypothetical protein
VYGALAHWDRNTPKLLMSPVFLDAGLVADGSRDMNGSIHNESEAVDVVSNLTWQLLESEVI